MDIEKTVEELEAERKAFVIRAWEIQAGIDESGALIAEEKDCAKLQALASRRSKLRQELEEVEDKIAAADDAIVAAQMKVEVRSKE